MQTCFSSLLYTDYCLQNSLVYILLNSFDAHTEEEIQLLVKKNIH